MTNLRKAQRTWESKANLLGPLKMGPNVGQGMRKGRLWCETKGKHLILFETILGIEKPPSSTGFPKKQNKQNLLVRSVGNVGMNPGFGPLTGNHQLHGAEGSFHFSFPVAYRTSRTSKKTTTPKSPSGSTEWGPLVSLPSGLRTARPEQ